MQRIVFLNVPARRSRGYFEYFYANLPRDNIVFVDALFGGLDVAARVKWSNDNNEGYLTREIMNLIAGNRPEEATIAQVHPFYDTPGVAIQENFIIVVCLHQQNMMDHAHQNSFLESMKRSGLQRQLRFGGTVVSFDKVSDVPLPFYLTEDIDRAAVGQVSILEFSIASLDEPRSIVMDRLQHFPNIEATRTFFGVNYDSDLPRRSSTNLKATLGAIKEWSGPLLNWRRILGG